MGTVGHIPSHEGVICFSVELWTVSAVLGSLLRKQQETQRMGTQQIFLGSLWTPQVSILVSVVRLPVGCAWRGSHRGVHELTRVLQLLRVHIKYTC